MSRNRILAVLFFGVLMAALDIAIIGPALPTIQQAFGVDARNIGWVFSIYVLMNLVSTPLMAKLSDIYGRRAVYVTDVALFGLGSAIVMLSPSFAVLLLGLVIGVGNAISTHQQAIARLQSNLNGAVFEVFHHAQRQAILVVGGIFFDVTVGTP